MFSMPAIRFHHQCVFQIADHLPCAVPVDVRLKDGSFMRMDWLGMICEHAAEAIPGLGYAKIRAHEVTPESGLFPQGWRRLESEEYVLGWRVERVTAGRTVVQGVYGVVDDDLWPIVIGQRGRVRSSPRLKVVKRAG